MNLKKSSLAVLSFFTVASCVLVANESLAKPANDEDRLSDFPTEGLNVRGKLEILWEEHAIPFIKAEHDEDVPFALGLIQAHLRIAQLEIMRNIAKGRISELIGPFTIDVDRAIRILNLGKAVPETIKGLKPESKVWAERFVEGLNAYIRKNKKKVPEDLQALGFDELREWNLEDLVTCWKLASLDVNWGIFFASLQNSDKKGADEAWKTILKVGEQSAPSFSMDDIHLAQSFFGFTRSGSNSIVIGKSKSKSGAGMIASDPHLGLNLPNTWMVVGFKSPSYQALGFVLPSLPAIALGRNEQIAWGGTNMWGLSSHLFALDEKDLIDAEVHTEEIQVRSWFSRTVKTRWSKWGPVISDIPFFKGKLKPTALRWMGHQASDELSSFLAISRAKDFKSFREAFATYAVSAQNMLYADKLGNIGHVLAYRMPIRPDMKDKSLRQPLKNFWVAEKKSTELPFAYNPKDNFIASANNRPFPGEPEVGWFYQSNDRINRWKELAQNSTELKVENLENWQMDTFSKSSLEICRQLIEKVKGKEDQEIFKTEIWRELSNWDGFYRAQSRSPVAFEILMAELYRRILETQFPEEEIQDQLARAASWKTIVSADLAKLSQNELLVMLQKEIPKANEKMQAFASWQDMHRIEAAHPLAYLPIVGSRYRFAEFGYGGGSDTILKTAAAMTGKKATSFYGTNARHISDMSDLDENYFVLFGGQDGWLKSKNSLDQLSLWKDGKYIKLPLSDDGVAKVFKRKLTLNP